MKACHGLIFNPTEQVCLPQYETTECDAIFPEIYSWRMQRTTKMETGRTELG